MPFLKRPRTSLGQPRGGYMSMLPSFLRGYKLVLDEQNTEPTVESDAVSFYTDDGTNAGVGTVSLRTNSITTGGWMDAGLDHGTWTPLIQDSSGNNFDGLAYPAGENIWYRVGNLFFINGYVTWTGKTSAVPTDIVICKGLPLGLDTPAPRQYNSTALISGVTWPGGTVTGLYFTHLGSNNVARLTWQNAGSDYFTIVSEMSTSGYFRFSWVLRAGA